MIPLLLASLVSFTSAESLFSHLESAIPSPSLFPSLANGFLGTVVGTDAIYINDLFTSEIEYLVGGCLSISKDDHPIFSDLINPEGRYELSGLCERLDKIIQEKGLDFVENGMGARKARISNPYAYDLLLRSGPTPNSTVSLDTSSAVVRRAC